jgi:restriction system protein
VLHVTSRSTSSSLSGKARHSSKAFIVDLLVAMRYGGDHDSAARRLGRTGDGGIDRVIDEDHLGRDRIYVQARRSGPATSAAVQTFRA